MKRVRGIQIDEVDEVGGSKSVKRRMGRIQIDILTDDLSINGYRIYRRYIGYR